MKRQAIARRPPRDTGIRSYGFIPDTFYRINTASVINDTVGKPFSSTQSDIQKMPVAQLIVAAAAAHS